MSVTTRYASKTEAELIYIIKDAAEAAGAMRAMGNLSAECKYLDQMNDASTELYRRRLAVLHLKTRDTSSRRHSAQPSAYTETMFLA